MRLASGDRCSFRLRNAPLLALIVGVLIFGTAADECGVTNEEAVDKASEAATVVSREATEFARRSWYEPVEGPVIGPWGPKDGDHQNADLEAIDYLGKTGTQIYAMAEGIVAFAGANCATKVPDADSCYGNAVAIEHKGGIYSIYTHLSAISDLVIGDEVTRDVQIGLMGESGCKGCDVHLHFVVRSNREGLKDTSALFLGTPVPIRDGKLKSR